MIFCQKEI